MKCEACGYSGILTVDTGGGHSGGGRWKCPQCHRLRQKIVKEAVCDESGEVVEPEVLEPLQHDPVDEGGKFVCSQCGMHGAKPEDLHTPCPGHGAHWNLPVYSCICGEWAFAPKPPQKTLICARCGVEYPEYLRADYVPPPPTKRGALSKADAELLDKLRVLLESETVKKLLGITEVK